MENEKVYISEDFIRLDNLLKFSGISQTGGQAKLIIQNEGVLLDGEVCTQRGKKIRPGDKVQYGERILEVHKK